VPAVRRASSSGCACTKTSVRGVRLMSGIVAYGPHL
jgi:hypothetical protein